MEEDIYVEVALPIAQYKTFTYRISSELYKNWSNSWKNRKAIFYSKGCRRNP